ncbi:MAG: hypothetical protein R3E79_07200 [Caldilineaceae bacterium]
MSTILTVFRPRSTPENQGDQRWPWPDLHIVQVIKRYQGRTLTAVERRLVHGTQQAAEALVFATQVGWGVFNTAYIERLNATFRTWLPLRHPQNPYPGCSSSAARSRLFLTAAVYNFCHPHASLLATPAMAADLTDSVWSIDQLLHYRPKRQ